MGKKKKSGENNDQQNQNNTQNQQQNQQQQQQQQNQQPQQQQPQQQTYRQQQQTYRQQQNLENRLKQQQEKEQRKLEKQQRHLETIQRQKLESEKRRLEKQKQQQERQEEQRLENEKRRLEKQKQEQLELEAKKPQTYHPGLDHHYYHVDRFLEKSGPLTDPSFECGDTPKEFMRKVCKVLVIGAGGLGCEILHNLAMLGFGDIHVIDMDTIDLSNLNRQFLFREHDIGQSKAEVAAKFIMNRVPQVKVTPHYCKIQDKDDDFYMMFNMVICGLDSVPARRWINATMVNLVDAEKPESLIPLIDGGTEGFKGQSRVILPTITSCYECSLDMLTPQTAFPMCTIANTPRLPEHCIEWASVLEWPRVFTEKKLDNDNPDHIQWLYEQASTRAKQHNITGVTWSLTQGVVKNIIPAIASTNAIIAASCCNEAFKIATSCAPYLQNYMMYNGSESIYTYTFKHEKKANCPVCGGESIELKLSKEWFLQQLIDLLIENPDFQIKQPSLSTKNGPLFFQGPPELKELTKPNLDKKLIELFYQNSNDKDDKDKDNDKDDRDKDVGIEITVTDPNLPFQLSLIVKLV